jgi:hypothetical protein
LIFCSCFFFVLVNLFIYLLLSIQIIKLIKIKCKLYFYYYYYKRQILKGRECERLNRMNRYNSSLGIHRNDECCYHSNIRNRSKSPYNSSQSPVRDHHHHHHHHQQQQHSHHYNNNNQNNHRHHPSSSSHNHHQNHHQQNNTSRHQKQQQHVHYHNPERSTPSHRYLPVNHEPAPIVGSFYEPLDQETFLRMKWVDNSPRMSRLRDHRTKRQINKLEVNSQKYKYICKVFKYQFEYISMYCC